jgi:hypothetical protein
VDEHAAGGLPVDAARAQVEERVLVELADGRPVRALDIVGVDLELRPGIDGRIRRQQDVAAGLLGIGLLGVRADDDPAAEDPRRPAAQDALVDLPAMAAGAGVVEDGEVVGVLLAALPRRWRTCSRPKWYPSSLSSCSL